ncbi:MAG: hypothetical protein WBM65_05115, partial [Sedimenticolaceae bacterium]
MAPSLDGGLNYAFTDALTGDGESNRFSVWTGEPLPPPLVPAIGDQIRMHVDAEGSINNDHLVVLWVGANEILSSVLQRNPGVLYSAVENIRQHIDEMVDLGAKHILVPNQIDASGAPF